MSEENDVDPSDFADPLITRESFDEHFEREEERAKEYRARTSYLTQHVGWECKAVASLTEGARRELNDAWPDLVQVAMFVADTGGFPEKVYDSDAFLGFIVRKLHSVQQRHAAQLHQQHHIPPYARSSGALPWHCDGDFALEVVGWISESGMFSPREALLEPAPPRLSVVSAGHTDSSESNGDSCPR